MAVFTLEDLGRKLDEWQWEQGLPAECALEQLHRDTLTPDQRRWLSEFVTQWEAAEAREECARNGHRAMAKAIAPWSNGAGSYGLSADIRGEGGAWHIWRNTQGRIICNGPTMATRLLDCADLDSAITAVWQSGAHDVARALQEIKEAVA